MVTGNAALYTTSALTGGSHTITATYTGDGNYNTSTSTPTTQTVNKATTTTSVVSSANPSTYGNTVTFTATVTSGATGNVQFYDNGNALGGPVTVSGNAALYTTSALTGGSHNITATYSGDGNFNTSTSTPITQTVNKAASTTSVISSANPSVYGDSVTFTATVTSGATGTVQFYENGNAIGGPVTITGNTALYNTSVLTGGSHTITATYTGDGNYNTSTSTPITQTVNKAASTTSVVSSANPSTYGDSVLFTATVTEGATGTVQFYDNGNAIGGPVTITGNTALYNTSVLIGGNHNITASYSGDGNYATSTSSAVTQTVAAAPVVTSQPAGTSVNAGATATFTAVAIGNPVPTVQWQLSTNGGSAWANIVGATITSYTTLPVSSSNDGSQYRAVFTNNLGSAVSSTAMLRVNQAPTITSQPLNVTTNPNSTATFTAAAAGSPTPAVRWQKNTGAGWTDIPGAIGASYTTPTLANGDSGTQYQAVFTNALGTATTNAATLTLALVANVSSTAVGWGTQTASLVDMGDGRLLPATRTKDIPWLGIATITLTLDQSIASLAAGDVSLKSAGGFTYSVSDVAAVPGSNKTSWTITLGGDI